MFNIYPRGWFGLGFLLSQNCPICNHSLSLHIGRDWQCAACGCTGFPKDPEPIPVISPLVCSCGHVKDAHYHGESLCGECSCDGWDPEEIK